MRVLHLIAFCGASVLAAPFGWAQDVSRADIVILGEVHDNPVHHNKQADLIAKIKPAAVIFEMLSHDQAAAVTSDLISDETALRAALDWDVSGWPDFGMYYPLFVAAPLARFAGAAVPRDVARKAMKSEIIQIFGDASDRFGLANPLPADQQSAREALQRAAHCDALPDEMLPAMVNIQRLRDASLAQAALAAFEEIGGPVVIITGNGHARKDWGVPAVLKRAAPEVSVISIGQGEIGQIPEGGFDSVFMAEPVERPDPCLAFR